VVDLKDKVVGDDFASKQIMPAAHNTSRDEALSALVMLGFSKSATEKVLDQIIREGGELTVEGLIKSALKRL